MKLRKIHFPAIGHNRERKTACGRDMYGLAIYVDAPAKRLGSTEKHICRVCWRVRERWGALPG